MKNWFPLVRLLLAGTITIAVLPYAWGRVMVVRLLAGRHDWLFAGVLLLAIAAILVLTRGLAGAFPRPRFHRFLAVAIVGAWVAINTVLMFFLTGPLLPWYLVLPAYLPATFCVVWLAWMFSAPLSWGTRLGVLGLCLAGVVLSGLVLKVEGLTGGSQVNFAWRWAAPKQEFVVIGSGTSRGAPDFKHIGEQDYPQYLGPQRLAVAPRARLARDWNSKPPREMWRRPVGLGWSAFAVAGDYAVTQEQRGAEECVVCYRVADGAEVWIHSDPVEFEGGLGGPGPRATPTIADGRLFSVGAAGVLNCLNGATGRVLWSVNTLKDNAAENLDHGVAASPLVIGDQVLVCPTGTNGISLAAYHKDTGKRRWQAGKVRASYGSPLLATLAGVPQVLLHNAEGVTAHDPGTGRILWSFPWTNQEKVNCSQPIPHAAGPDQVFISTGYGKGSALLRIERSTAEPWPVSVLWEGRHLKTKFTTAVVHDGCVYGLDDGILECVDLQTGNRLWKDGRYQHGQVLLAGDLLLIQAESGAVVLVEPSRQGLRELGRYQALHAKTWNHPALAGRYLLVRNDQEAVCLELALAGE